jgi:hypothetical protein
MKPTRDDIVELLRRNADAATPPADPAFVGRLERHLRSIDLSPSKAGRKRFGGFTIGAIVAGTMIAGAAAAAGVVSWRNSSSQSSATTVAAVAITSTTLTPVSTTIEVATTTSLPVTTVAPPTTIRAALVPATTMPPLAPTDVETTTSISETTLPPPTTADASSVTTSTEVRVAATLTLTCVPATAATSCSWDAGPNGTVTYALLRTEPGGSAGRVFTPEPGSTTYVDTLVVAGITYTYLVHALDAGGHSLAHSGPVSTPCCG